MAKVKETIEIPISLARILSSEPDDMKDVEQYENVQRVGRSCLRLMMSVEKNKER